MKKAKPKPVVRTCARRLDLARQSLKTARGRLYEALGHKGFADEKPQIRAGVLRIYKTLEAITPQLAHLARLQADHERGLKVKAHVEEHVSVYRGNLSDDHLTHVEAHASAAEGV